MPENKTHYSRTNNHRTIRQLQNTKSKRRSFKRSLSGHITTRWYRAPEVILMEKEYGLAIDMWAVGCIAGELFQKYQSASKENSSATDENSPLFRGSSCFPLSPRKVSEVDGMPLLDNKDQLFKILEVIGAPTEDDKSFVSDETAEKYLESFKHSSSQTLGQRFS